MRRLRCGRYEDGTMSIGSRPRSGVIPPPAACARRTRETRPRLRSPMARSGFRHGDADRDARRSLRGAGEWSPGSWEPPRAARLRSSAFPRDVGVRIATLMQRRRPSQDSLAVLCRRKAPPRPEARPCGTQRPRQGRSRAAGRANAPEIARLLENRERHRSCHGNRSSAGVLPCCTFAEVVPRPMP